MSKSNKVFFLNLLLIFFRLAADAQNLVPNPSFEEHPSIYTSAYNTIEFAQLMKGWHSTSALLSVSPNICINDREHRERFRDNTRWGHCDFSKYSPKSGRTVLEVAYTKFLNGCHTETDTDILIGGSPYAEARLLATLHTDSIYKISIWLNVWTQKNKEYITHFSKFMGVDFTESSVSNQGCTIISWTPFVADTVVYDSWVEYVWYIKPSKELKYIQVGTFMDYQDIAEEGKNLSWKSANEGGGYSHASDARTAIDDISITKAAADDTAAIAQAIVYPFTTEPENTIETTVPKDTAINTNCFFASNSDVLDEAAKRSLDTIATLLLKKKVEVVYEIVGHADNIGGNGVKNTDLSMRRAQTVYQYLTKEKGVPSYFFTLDWRGNTNAIADTSTEQGRSKNRRVELKKKENIRFTQHLYQLTDRAVIQKNTDSAFIYLTQWVLRAEKWKMLPLFDTDLDPLQKDPRWQKIRNIIVHSYDTCQKPRLAFLLDSLYYLDQRYRTLDYYFEGEKTRVTVAIDTMPQSLYDTLCNHSSEITLPTLERLIQQDGWPKRSEVGERPASAAFYVVDHANAAAMKKYLPMLKMACENKEANWDWYAMMYDRFEMYEGRPQLYGTQYVPAIDDPMHYILHTLVDKEHVDEIRAKIGLKPIDTWEIWLRVSK